MDLESTTDEHATTSIDIDASVEHVWQALTSDQGLATWMGAGSSMGDDVGDGLVLNDLVSGDVKHGVVDEFDPHHVLRYRWWPAGGQAQVTQVEIELEPCVAGTRVTVVESRPSTPSAVAAAAGWAWRSALLVLAVEAIAAVQLTLR